MSFNFDDWKPMAEDFESIRFNSYTSGQLGAHLPVHCLPAFGSQTNGTEPKRQQSVKLFIDGFPTDLTESGLKNYLKRIGCRLSGLKIVQSRTNFGRHYGFIDFENTKSAQKAIELIKSQNTYKFNVSFATTETQKQNKELLIARETEEFVTQVESQREMKQKIDLGNCSAINGNTSPANSDHGSLDSSVMEVLAPLAKTDKLLKVLQTSAEECSYCNGEQAVEHLHYILSDQRLVDPLAVPELLDLNISCSNCNTKSADLKLCSRCKGAVYCSHNCQSVHWKEHKHDCNPDESLSFLLSSLNLSENPREREKRVENLTPVFGKESQKSITPTVSSVRQQPKESTPLANGSKSPPKRVEPTVVAKKAPEVLVSREMATSSDEIDSQSVPKRVGPPVMVSKEPVVTLNEDNTVTTVKKISDSLRMTTIKPQMQFKVSPRNQPIECEVLRDGETDVVLGFGRNPFDFYLQNSSVYEKMDVFSEEIDKKKNIFPVLTEDLLKPGTLCGGIWSVDGVCYRAKIIKRVDEKTCALYFVDYGNTEPVVVSDIKCLPNIFFDCKAQAIPCCLFDIEPIGDQWSKESEQFFGKIAEKAEYTKVKIYEKTTQGLYKIDLLNGKGDSIRKEFVDKKFAIIPSEMAVRTPVSSPKRTPQQSVSGDSPVIVDGSPKVVLNKSSINEAFGYKKQLFVNKGIDSEVDNSSKMRDEINDEITDEVVDHYIRLPLIQLPLKKSLEAMVVYQAETDKKLFYIVKNDKDLEKLTVGCAELGLKFNEANSRVKTIVGNVYLVRASDNEWYRALINSVAGDQVNVQFIDFGNFEDVDSKYVMQLPEELQVLAVPPVAIKCKVESSKLSEEDLLTKIAKATDGTFLLKVEPLRFEGGIHFVKVK